MSTESDDGAALFESVIHHLLVEHEADMLDKTKCSVSARRIYNFLCDDREDIKPNDNMPDQVCSRSVDLVRDLLSRETKQSSSSDHEKEQEQAADVECTANDGNETVDRDFRVYYVHLDHLTNETSHYFILCCRAGRVVVLQSAVFEYSIEEWLHPVKALRDVEAQMEALDRSIDRDARDGCDDNDLDQLRNLIEMTYNKTELKKQAGIYQAIMESPFSMGRTMTVAEFIHAFVFPLASLEGTWTAHDVNRNCAVFRRLFACELPREIIAAHVRGGIKPAVLKFIAG